MTFNLKDRRIVILLGVAATASIAYNILLPMFGPSIASEADDVPAYVANGVLAPTTSSRVSADASPAHGDQARALPNLTTDLVLARDPFSLPNEWSDLEPMPVATDPEPISVAVVEDQPESSLEAVLVTTNFRAVVIDGRLRREGADLNGRTITQIDTRGYRVGVSGQPTHYVAVNGTQP